MMRTNKSHFFLGLLSLCMSFCDAAVEPKHHCIDFVLNADESDIDCGGAKCAPCATGKACGADKDCATTLCRSNQCVAPSCMDNVKNQDETDVDCGGSCLTKCPDGAKCKLGTDCVGGACSAGLTCFSCTNTVKDGDESDVDCGGSCSTNCADGKACAGNADCQSGNCMGNTCQPAGPP